MGEVKSVGVGTFAHFPFSTATTEFSSFKPKLNVSRKIHFDITKMIEKYGKIANAVKRTVVYGNPLLLVCIMDYFFFLYYLGLLFFVKHCHSILQEAL